ncbi:hypothetical protein HD806DRAFT_522834 [Xylariaceae sp. AK1471]|nr:hypothetical protein HD806DRAFT_522834 [Xylariaceae sp. AK1471]
MQVSANKARAAQQQPLYHDDTHTQSIAHSGRLVYAKPQDLPSFPSLGLDAKGTAAGTAATLGWANKKSPEPWRPGKSVTASTAAIMAEDYKPAPAWEPVASSHGAKAALLAAQSATSHGAWKPSSTEDGVSAAALAFKSNRANTRSINSETLERHRSMVAAKGAVARRQRADSAPIPRESYPDEANAAANALSAATRAHRPALSPVPFQEAGAIPYTTMNKLMFTSRPPVKLEVDEQKRADVLHASAVAMAKKMYNQQQKMIEAKKSHADKTSPRDDSDVFSSVSDDPQPAQLTTLQDAAYKQAQARLAKMQQENTQNRDLQEYYGTKPVSRRFSVTGKLRKRSLSDGAVIEDQKRSQQIRKQMSFFSNKLSEIDEQKRHQDQEFLLAAAQRNVHERLKSMDEKIATETGMVPPSTLTQWELKARAVAHSRAAQREDPHKGKVNIGSGKYMDQEDINVIAARRIQPILDEINQKAELEHARQTELRLEVERNKEEQEVKKARQREVQDIQKKLKQQEKQEQKEKKAEEKQEAKAKKEEERAIKAEQKRLAQAENPKSAEHDQGATEEPEPQENIVVMNSDGQPTSVSHLRTQEAQIRTRSEESEESPKSPRNKSPPGRVKTWFKSRFSRGPKSPDEEQKKGKPSERGFIGGVSLTGIQNNESSASLDNRSASVRAVAMAGRNSGTHQPRLHGDPEAVSPLSSESGDEYFRDEARDQPITQLTPPRPIRDSASAKSCSPTRDSRFHEIL